MATTAPVETVTDESLAEVVARRDRPGGSMASARTAFERLYDRHASLLLAFLRARAGIEADDLHQLVWLRVWEHLPASQPGPFRGWLHQIARHAMIDMARKKRPGLFGDGQAEAIADGRHASPAGSVEDRERAEALGNCLAKLPPEAAALVRRRLGGEEYEVIAAALQLTTARAHKLFYKAKEYLKSCVERALI